MPEAFAGCVCRLSEVVLDCVLDVGAAVPEVEEVCLADGVFVVKLDGVPAAVEAVALFVEAEALSSELEALFAELELAFCLSELVCQESCATSVALLRRRARAANPAR
jgi:hypothetical protein